MSSYKEACASSEYCRALEALESSITNILPKFRYFEDRVHCEDELVEVAKQLLSIPRDTVRDVFRTPSHYNVALSDSITRVCVALGSSKLALIQKVRFALYGSSAERVVTASNDRSFSCTAMACLLFERAWNTRQKLLSHVATDVTVQHVAEVYRRVDNTSADRRYILQGLVDSVADCVDDIHCPYNTKLKRSYTISCLLHNSAKDIPVAVKTVADGIEGSVVGMLDMYGINTLDIAKACITGHKLVKLDALSLACLLVTTWDHEILTPEKSWGEDEDADECGCGCMCGYPDSANKNPYVENSPAPSDGPREVTTPAAEQKETATSPEENELQAEGEKVCLWAVQRLTKILPYEDVVAAIDEAIYQSRNHSAEVTLSKLYTILRKLKDVDVIGLCDNWVVLGTVVEYLASTSFSPSEVLFGIGEPQEEFYKFIFCDKRNTKIGVSCLALYLICSARQGKLWLHTKLETKISVGDKTICQ